jgi:hypothetical protein
MRVSWIFPKNPLSGYRPVLALIFVATAAKVL